MRTNIIKTADIVTSNLKLILKNRIISLKIDGASCKDKSILGINVQFISDEGTQIIKTLAMVELVESHTSKYPKEKVSIKHQISYILSPLIKKFNL